MLLGGVASVSLQLRTRHRIQPYRALARPVAAAGARPSFGALLGRAAEAILANLLQSAQLQVK